MSALSMAAYTIAASPLHTKLANLSFTHTQLAVPAHRFLSKSIIKPLKPFRLDTQNPNSLSHFRGAFATSFDNFERDPDENITAQDDPINETEDFEQDVEQEEEDEDDDDEEADVKASELNEEGKLYVGNLPYSMTSSELAEVFEEAGQVISAAVIYDRVTDRSRGFGFVTMGSVEEAKEAIRMFNGSQVGGRTVRVNFPEVPKGGEREIMGPKMQSGSKGFIDSPHKLYAGNLGWRLTSEGLRDAFADQPGLLSAKVIYERDSGRSRGFGFVSFETAANAEAAIEAMNGVEVEGRPLRLDSAAAGEGARPPPVQENSAKNDPESSELLSRMGS